MIPIYLCDDDKEILQILTNTINNSIAIQDYDTKIVGATTDPLELIQRLKENTRRSIYFLDVDLRHEQYGGTSFFISLNKIKRG